MCSCYRLVAPFCICLSCSKSDSSPVTVADFSVQAIVLGLLHRYFPYHGFIAEETSAVLQEDPAALAAVLDVVRRVFRHDVTMAELCAVIDLGGRGHGKLDRERQRLRRGARTWVLDPIDGTKGFLRGEQFCVALVRLLLLPWVYINRYEYRSVRQHSRSR